MRAVISDVESDIELLKKKAKQVVPIERLDLISKVTTKQTYHWTEGLWNNGCKSLSDNQLSGRAKVLVYDFGTKRNILRQLVNAGFDVWVASAYDFDAVKEYGLMHCFCQTDLVILPLLIKKQYGLLEI